jgi:hypothetical protein
MKARFSIQYERRAAMRKIATLPYARIIAVHITPNAFRVSSVRDFPQIALNWRSFKAMGGSLENIPYVGIGAPPQFAASLLMRTDAVTIK